jgi:hypothetical protein
MTRMIRIALLSGILVVAGLAFPSIADAQRGGGGRGGGAAARGGSVHGGGAVVRGGGVYGGSHLAVRRTYPPYSSPYYRSYYSRGYYSYPYYYRPYYAGYYPYSYSPWSFSLSVGWYGGGWYAPSIAYPYSYYGYPPAYPAYPYPSASQPPYNGTVSTGPPDGSQSAGRVPTAHADEQGDFGTLTIRVMPSDAAIVIDRQAWDRPHDDERFSIELVQGPHQVEIHKAGYATYLHTIDVPRGRSVVLNVALTPGGTGTPQVARTVPFRH